MSKGPERGSRGEPEYLRPLEPEDADLVSGWYADDRVSRLLGDPPTSYARRRQSYGDAVTRDGNLVFRIIIRRLDNDIPFGRIDVFEIDLTNGNCAFGIAIGGPALWGQGPGSGAVHAVVHFVFGEDPNAMTYGSRPKASISSSVKRARSIWIPTSAFGRRPSRVSRYGRPSHMVRPRAGPWVVSTTT